MSLAVENLLSAAARYHAALEAVAVIRPPAEARRELVAARDAWNAAVAALPIV